MIVKNHSSLGSPSLRASLVAIIVFFSGAVNIYSAWIGILPARLSYLEKVLPFELHIHSRTLTVLVGILLMMLSWSLYRRKRHAWITTLILMTLTTFLHLVKGLDYEEAILSIIVIFLLIYSRKVFYVKSDPSSFYFAFIFTFVLIVGIFIYGLLGFKILEHHFQPEFTLSRGLRSTFALVTLTQFSEPELLLKIYVKQIHKRKPFHLNIQMPKFSKFNHNKALTQKPLNKKPIPSEPSLTIQVKDKEADWFCKTLEALAYFASFYIFGALLRPVASKLIYREYERSEIKHLLEKSGGCSLAYWTLLPGLHYQFTRDRKSVLAYRLIDSVAIVLGEPIGDQTANHQMLDEFNRTCHINDWLPAWYQVDPSNLSLYQAQGFKSLKIGEEAFIDLDKLELKGKSWQDFRTAINRLTRESYKAIWYDLKNDPRGWFGKLENISNQWLKSQHGEEKTFSLGTWQTFISYSNEQKIFVLCDNHSEPVAFVSFVPIYGKEFGWSLDLMRRGANAPKGAMDYLLIQAMLELKADGFKSVSLGLSPLASVDTGNSTEASVDLIDRIRKLVFEHFTRIYNFQGLMKYKQKFKPRWEPRYLVYPSIPQLPKVIIALIKAHNPKKIKVEG